jgi:penicillin-insensitive murein endopeptidase
MLARTGLYLLLAVVLGALAFEGAGRYSRAQSPAPDSTVINATNPDGAAGPAAPAPPEPAQPAESAAPPAPAETTPPVVVAPPAPSAATSTPAVTAPIVTAPAPTPPAASAPPASAPVVASPPAAAAPVVVAPSAPTPAAIAPSEVPTIAHPPMPPIKADKADRKHLKLAAYDLFGAKKLPSIGHAASIGYYPAGCLAGGVQLPIDGPNWQVMRLSRNRNWGHPNLIRFIESFAARSAKATGWHGILVGDLAQPRGGPTRTGHKSHQTGLDVDIWFLPMPDHKLTRQQREDISASNLVASDWKHINPKTWSPQYINFIKTAALSPGVERVLVNAAIKKELCRAVGPKTDWLRKVRPWYGHHDHIHVRLACPPDSPNCRHQPPVPEDEGCGKALDYWFSDRVLKPVTKFKPKKPMTLADLPAACKTVLAAPAK